MRKILTIAFREYRSMVATKAFLISIAVMPILMFGGMVGAFFIQQAGNSEAKRIAIFDPSDVYYSTIVDTATRQKLVVGDDADPGEDDPLDDAMNRPKLRFVFERIESDAFTDNDRFALSQRIKQGDLYAFVEIPEGIESTAASKTDPAPIPRFYSEDASLSDSRSWIENVVMEKVKSMRMAELEIDEAKVRLASRPVILRPMGLVQKDAEGNITTKASKNIIVALLLPIAVMMLMFMVIFLSAQPVLESVLEEKTQRIAEVLLGSANPFQLMSGKLIGTVAGSLTAFSIYFAGTLILVYSRGWGQYVPLEIAPWFVVFQILGVMFYASIFMAVGASVSQAKEAQAMLMPVWMIKMSPMFIWIFAVQEPNGKLATWMSFFPPVTPTMMMLRLSTGQSIPLWQPILGAVLLAAFTILGIFIAGRIFRIGILWQGKTPKLTELFRWGMFGA